MFVFPTLRLLMFGGSSQVDSLPLIMKAYAFVILVGIGATGCTTRPNPARPFGQSRFDEQQARYPDRESHDQERAAAADARNQSMMDGKVH
jgi:hypothetical protein